MAGLSDLQDDLEAVDGIGIAVTEHDDDWGGVVMHLTLTEAAGGTGEELIDEVLNTIPRDVLPEDYDPDERVDIYYDAIDIYL